jgi:hypothetical protein
LKLPALRWLRGSCQGELGIGPIDQQYQKLLTKQAAKKFMRGGFRLHS